MTVPMRFEIWSGGNSDSMEVVPGGPDTNEFNTEDEAWEAVEELRNLGDGWDIAEYDVRPVPEF